MLQIQELEDGKKNADIPGLAWCGAGGWRIWWWGGGGGFSTVLSSARLYFLF